MIRKKRPKMQSHKSQRAASSKEQAQRQDSTQRATRRKSRKQSNADPKLVSKKKLNIAIVAQWAVNAIQFI